MDVSYAGPVSKLTVCRNCFLTIHFLTTKTLFAISLALILSVYGFGQSAFIDFSSSSDLIAIDTSNPNNIWQIGRPQKSFLNSAYTIDNAIITDTVNSYPVNDTSSFIMKVPEDLLALYSTGTSGGNIVVSFYTKYQTDSLNDFGRIEFSSDSGTTWHIMDVDYRDTSFLHWHQGWNTFTDGFSGWSFNDKSLYTGQSDGWEYQEIDLFVCSVLHPKREDSTATIIGCYPKSLWLKFVFVSDSVSDNLDGWAIDNFSAYGVQYAGLTDAKNSELKVAPNPFSSQLMFSFVGNEQTAIILYDFLGQKVMQQEFTNSTTINTAQIPDGVYFYELMNKNKEMLKTGKVVKQ